MPNLWEIKTNTDDIDYEIKDYSINFKDANIDNNGLFKGYAAYFDNKEDLGGDIIAPGAFIKTIAANGKFGNGIKFLWQHNSGSLIGVWEELSENNTGLKVIGRFAIETQLGHDAYILTKMKAVQGLSIGFFIDIVEEDFENKRRILKEVSLIEISEVTFPMKPNARITAVKGAIENAKTERQIERALRDAGLSRSSAQYISSLCKQSLRLEKNSGNLKDLLKELKSVNADLLINRLINDESCGMLDNQKKG